MMWPLYRSFYVPWALVISVLSLCVSEAKWETVEVVKVLDNQRFQLKNYQIVHLAGIRSPDLLQPTKEDQCLSRPLWRILKSRLEHQKVKIWTVDADPGDYNVWAYVKLPDTTLLSEQLLSEGLVRLDSQWYDSKYKMVHREAQDMAKRSQHGLWSGCNPWNSLARSRYKKGKSGYLDSLHHWLGSVTAGEVEKAISGTVLQMRDGPKVKILALADIPVGDDGGRCFNHMAQSYLDSMLVGQRVLLVGDREELDGNGHLLRHVYRPQTKYRNEVFMNKKIIQDGFGKFDSSFSGIRYYDDFASLQKQVYQYPKGAWRACAKALLEKAVEIPKKTLVYDADCPIKGNVSGSRSNPKKTYHTPASGWYQRLDPEQCFAGEEAAIAAGFEKVK